MKNFVDPAVVSLLQRSVRELEARQALVEALGKAIEQFGVARLASALISESESVASV